MKVYGDIERVNLRTGERYRRVSGDGESRLVRVGCADESLEQRVRRLEQRADAGDLANTRLGPPPITQEEIQQEIANVASRIAEQLEKEKQPMPVRAKFKVNSIDRQLSYEGKELQTIKLSPVTTGSEENKQFYAYTPSGHIDLGTVNAEAAQQFELGKEYYVDFTPAN